MAYLEIPREIVVTVTGKGKGEYVARVERSGDERGQAKISGARRHTMRAFREHNLDNSWLCAHRAFNYLHAIVLHVSALS